MTKVEKIQTFAWGLTIFVAGLGVIAWADSMNWGFANMTTYDLFPLFGLLAFSLMWSHYIASVARQSMELEKPVLSEYFEITSLMVLILILLHPGLLSFQLWKDGLGLPPSSDLNFVSPASHWAILFAFTALSIFLIYEFRRFYGKRKWWKYVEIATDIAMVLIYFHALRLGSSLMSGWYKYVWYFYGLTLVASLIYIYNRKLAKALQK